MELHGAEVFEQEVPQEAGAERRKDHREARTGLPCERAPDRCSVGEEQDEAPDRDGVDRVDDAEPGEGADLSRQEVTSVVVLEDLDWIERMHRRNDASAED